MNHHPHFPQAPRCSWRALTWAIAGVTTLNVVCAAYQWHNINHGIGFALVRTLDNCQLVSTPIKVTAKNGVQELEEANASLRIELQRMDEAKAELSNFETPSAQGN